MERARKSDEGRRRRLHTLTRTDVLEARESALNSLQPKKARRDPVYPIPHVAPCGCFGICDAFEAWALIWRTIRVWGEKVWIEVLLSTPPLSESAQQDTKADKDTTQKGRREGGKGGEAREGKGGQKKVGVFICDGGYTYIPSALGWNRLPNIFFCARHFRKYSSILSLNAVCDSS